MKMKKVKKVLVAALVVSNVLTATAPALAHASESEVVHKELTDEEYAEIEQLLEEFKRLENYGAYFNEENVQPENVQLENEKPAENYKEVKEKTKQANKEIDNIEKEVDK